MAVSGRKPDFCDSVSLGSAEHDLASLGSPGRDSVSLGSAEDFNHCCDACFTTGQQIEAHGFCVECQEYLCKNCSMCHERTKASRNHHLLDKDNIGKHVITNENLDVCTEKCPLHRNELIKFFCQEHDALGCSACIIMYHRSCVIDYIPEKCTNIGDSDQYRKTVRLLDQKMEKVGTVMKMAKVKDDMIDECSNSLIKEIVKFREDINGRLDHLQLEFQNEAEKNKCKDKLTVQSVLTKCGNICSDIKELLSDLNDTRLSGKTGKLYISLKQAQSVLKADDVKSIEDTLKQTNVQYTFECNKSLLDVLFMQNTFGKLILGTKTFVQLTLKDNINIETQCDEMESSVSGCAVMSSGKLVLADNYNKKLKVVDTQRKVVIEEKILEAGPWDIAVLPEDLLAVTLPETRAVLILKSADKLLTVRRIQVNCLCRGVAYQEGRIYVVCSDPNCIVILGTEGDIHSTVPLNSDLLHSPRYIALSKDSKLIYISDYNSRSVASITLQGDVAAVYKHKDLKGPEGILTLDDGSLLVCCENSGTIHYICRDMKQGETKIDRLRQTQCICYNHQNHEIYTASWNSDKLKVFYIVFHDSSYLP